MKAPAEMNGTETLTAERLGEKLTQLEQQIARKVEERERLRETIQRLVLEHTGSDLAAVRERRRLDELDAEIRQLEQSRGIFEHAIGEAQERERHAVFTRRLEEAKRRGDGVSAMAAQLEEGIVGVVKHAARLREALAEFDAGLPGSDPQDFMRGELSACLMRHIEMSAYVKSEGALRPRGIIESPFEMKQAGRGAIERTTRDYVTIALRNRTPRRDLQA
jgi:chromosome segregation ATPase